MKIARGAVVAALGVGIVAGTCAPAVAAHKPSIGDHKTHAHKTKGHHHKSHAPKAATTLTATYKRGSSIQLVGRFGPVKPHVQYVAYLGKAGATGGFTLAESERLSAGGDYMFVVKAPKSAGTERFEVVIYSVTTTMVKKKKVSVSTKVATSAAVTVKVV